MWLLVKLLFGLVEIWGRSESVKSEEIGGDDGQDHENVEC